MCCTIKFYPLSSDSVSNELSEVYSRLHAIDADSAPARFLSPLVYCEYIQCYEYIFVFLQGCSHTGWVGIYH